jgi:hypothetical protein
MTLARLPADVVRAERFGARRIDGAFIPENTTAFESSPMSGRKSGIDS